MRRFRLPLGVLGLLFVGSLLFAEPKTGFLIGQKAPNFSLKTMDGKSLSLYTLKGKVVILNFWATWCGPCLQEIPDFIALDQAYSKKGLQILGLSVDDTVSKQFLQDHGVSYPVMIITDTIAKAYGGINAIPTTFILDKNGVIIDKVLGSREADYFERKFKEILK